MCQYTWQQWFSLKPFRLLKYLLMENLTFFCVFFNLFIVREITEFIFVTHSMQRAVASGG